MVGDEAQLYRSLAARLEQTVRVRVRAPREVVEDACHHAWTQLINHGERVNRDSTFTWLATTAVRHAWKLSRREHRELSLDAAAEDLAELAVPSNWPGPSEWVELREQLQHIADLPERQRRFVWLRAVGLSYVEMAAYTGDTVRTVERQVLRATERLREAEAEQTRAEHTIERDRGTPGHDAGRRSREDRGLER